MKLAVLYSGGKDSNYALYKANQEHDIECLIVMKSKNTESYMFQSIGIDYTQIQSECLDIPILEIETLGEKESELKDLDKAIKTAKEKYKIDGIVTGAINSCYQSSRIQTICNKYKLWCYNPLWQKDQVKFLHELIENKFKIIIAGVASYPLEEKHLGKIIDEKLIQEFVKFNKESGFNPAGEGGEIETFIIDQPMFKKEIKIKKFHTEYDNYYGNMYFDEIELIEKK